LERVDPYRPQPPLRVLAERLGLKEIVKLASNEGAFGPLPAAVDAFRAAVADLGRYPDGGATALRAALAERYRLPPEQVVPGNGADELIRLCAVAMLDAGDAAAFGWPSFPSYPASAAVQGADPLQLPLRDHTVDLEAILAACARPAPRGGRVRLVYVANPNNPTGTLLPRREVRRFLEALPEEVMCVLDEAYAEYADEEPEGPTLVRAGRAPLCVLRTFSKVHGLAGLRIGYALASPDVADALDRVRPIFNVGHPSQEAALAALSETSAVAERVAHARSAREQVRSTLAEAGLRPVPSQANFVYADTPDGDGDGLADRLLRAGFVVRALRGFGAPGAIRVTCGTDAENAAFARALPRVVAGR
jgi:histidinol-phosphate aminotransferase